MSAGGNKIERLRAAFDRFATTGEVDGDFFASDFEVRQASSIVDTAGTFRGEDALAAPLRELRESFEGLRFEPEEFVEAPNGDILVRVHVSGRGRGSGIEIDNDIAWVVAFRGDEAVRMVVYEEPSEALEAVGLR